jgi:hypothetical protein
MDIVERLRWRIHTSHDVNALTNEAADEIERLREAAKDRPNESADEIERLRELFELERIADVSERWPDSLVSQINEIARAALKDDD